MNLCDTWDMRSKGTSVSIYRDFVLASEVGGLAEELGLRDGQGAGSVSDKHRVVQAGVTSSWREQVPAL